MLAGSRVASPNAIAPLPVPRSIQGWARSSGLFRKACRACWLKALQAAGGYAHSRQHVLCWQLLKHQAALQPFRFVELRKHLHVQSSSILLIPGQAGSTPAGQSQ